MAVGIVDHLAQLLGLLGRHRVTAALAVHLVVVHGLRLLVGILEQLLQHLRVRHALELLVEQDVDLGGEVHELAIRVELVDQAVDHVVHGRVVDLRTEALAVPNVRWQDAVLERHVEVLVQHNEAQLLACQVTDERCAVQLVLAVGCSSGHVIACLGLAHAHDAGQQRELVVAHHVDVARLDFLVGGKFVKAHGCFSCCLRFSSVGW